MIKMSTPEEKCPKCGKLKKDCTCDPAINPDRVINIVHTFEKGKGFDAPAKNGSVIPPIVDPNVAPVVDPVVPPVDPKNNDDVSLEDLKEKLATEKKKREGYEQIIALQAEKTFKEEKTAVLAQIPEDKREEIEALIGDNPDVLEDVKRDLVLRKAFILPAAPVVPDPNATPDKKAKPDESKTPEEEFQGDLDEFLGQIEDENKREELKERFVFDPKDPQTLEVAKEKLSDAKMMTAILKQAVIDSGARIKGQKGPAGKVPLTPPIEGAGNFKEYIDTLYATLRDPSKTQQEKDAANGMLDQLFSEMVKGLRIAKGKYGHAVESYQIMECPQCHVILTGERGEVIDNCQVCGWQKYKAGAQRG